MCLFQDFNLNIEKRRIPFRSRKQWFRKDFHVEYYLWKYPG